MVKYGWVGSGCSGLLRLKIDTEGHGLFRTRTDTDLEVVIGK